MVEQKQVYCRALGLTAAGVASVLTIGLSWVPYGARQWYGWSSALMLAACCSFVLAGVSRPEAQRFASAFGRRKRVSDFSRWNVDGIFASATFMLFIVLLERATGH